MHRIGDLFHTRAFHTHGGCVRNVRRKVLPMDHEAGSLRPMSKRRRTTEGLAGRWEWIFGSTAAGFGVCGRCDMADGTNEISEMRIPEQGRMQGCFWLCMPLRAVATILFHISAHRCLETRKSDSLAQFMMLICRSVGERRTAHMPEVLSRCVSGDRTELSYVGKPAQYRSMSLEVIPRAQTSIVVMLSIRRRLDAYLVLCNAHTIAQVFQIGGCLRSTVRRTALVRTLSGSQHLPCREDKWLVWNEPWTIDMIVCR